MPEREGPNFRSALSASIALGLILTFIYAYSSLRILPTISPNWSFLLTCIGVFMVSFSSLGYWHSAGCAYWYGVDYEWDWPFHLMITDYWTYMDWLLTNLIIGMILLGVGAFNLGLAINQ